MRKKIKLTDEEKQQLLKGVEEASKKYLFSSKHPENKINRKKLNK